MDRRCKFSWAKQKIKSFTKQSRSIRSNLLVDLTIVIPTFERPEFLLRNIVFLLDSGASIVVVDGSYEPLPQYLLDDFADIKNLTYIHARESYVDRVTISLALISTNYAMCLADDDFVLPSGLAVAIQELDENQNFGACMGQASGFDYCSRDQRVKLIPYGQSLHKYSVPDRDPLTRLAQGLSNYRTATPYAVFRAHYFKYIWHSMETCSCLEATEYEHAMLTYSVCPLTTINDIYWIRSFECMPVDSAIDGSRNTDFHKWWKDPVFLKEREQFRSRVIENLYQSKTGGSKLVVNIFDEAVENIISHSHVGLMNINWFFKLVSKVREFLTKSEPFSSAYYRLMRTKFGAALKSRFLKFSRGEIKNINKVLEKDANPAIREEMINLFDLIESFYSSNNDKDFQRKGL